ncbi:Cap15 family cyclic dinucleotide receptor domain-containing protein (plasmid) [Methylocaldum sp. MU1018]
MQPHEYSIIGHSRSTVGRHLGTLAGLISSVCVLIVTVLLDIANNYGLSHLIPDIVLLPISAAAIYPLGHWAFDTWVWKHPRVLKFLKIPNLNGEWICNGKTLNADGDVIYEWPGAVRISQTWEKIRVYLDTGSSKSASVSAALINEPGRGFLLMYSYRNEPTIGQKELNHHVDYCELAFNETTTKAEGDYFNNKGRITFGRMVLTRKG